jgi:hypothetical protein
MKCIYGDIHKIQVSYTEFHQNVMYVKVQLGLQVQLPL